MIIETSQHRLFVMNWQPATPSDARVFIVHGLGEHVGRYECFANYLVGKGYHVTGFDQAGHGKSSGHRGHLDAFSSFENDLTAIFRWINQTDPCRYNFLIGHSMGGTFVLRCQPAIGAFFDGIIALSPFLRFAEWATLKNSVIQALGKLVPEHQIPNGLNPADLSRDQRIVEAYCQDPLVYPKISFRLAAILAYLGQALLSTGVAHKAPLLLMQGLADRICRPEFFDRFSCRIGPAGEIKRWKGIYHELLNAPEHNQVYDHIGDWMQRWFTTMA